MAPKQAKVAPAKVAAAEETKVAAKVAEKKEEPPKKKAKTEEKAKVEAPKAEEPKKEEPKKEEVKEEPKVEQETDAAADKRPQIKEAVVFEPADCTLNVLPTMQGKVLMSLSDGGMQFLIAGARANVGIKAGRYFFEAKVIEALNPAEAAGNRGRVPLPRQLLRIGFSTAGSQLVLGEADDGICFDAEGTFTVDCKKKTVAQRFGKNQTMGVLLNLDPKSPNADTISLFHNGERYCEPQALPEALKGKTLYPHVSYRNVSVHVNFGPEPMSALPFKCRTIQNAAAADVVVAKSTLPKDGKYEVMFPVAFPDEGTFDWLDTFLEKNPHFVELSDRKLIDWASKSGLFKPKTNTNSAKNSNDRPEFNYGLTAMDDISCRRVLQAVAPFVPRNYVVMEVKENLTAEDRIATIKRFNNPMYKKVAAVVMGEPNDEYKQVVHTRVLKEKKEKAKAEWEAKKKEKERKKQLALRQKQLADMRKKAEEQRKKAEAEKKKKAEEAKKAREELAAKKKAEAEAKIKEQMAKKKEEEAKKKAEAKEKAKEAKAKAKEAGEEVAESEPEEEEEEKEAEKEAEKEEAAAEETKEEAKAEEAKEEPKEEEAEKEEEKEEEKKEEEDEMDEDPPEVELTDEDKKVWFRPPTVTDLTSVVMSSAFGKFTLPEKSEGFDEIRYEWQPAAKANAYIRNWVMEKKVTSKMEDLKPSAWFKGKHDAFTKVVKEWQTKQKPFEVKKKAEAKAAAKKAAEKKKAGAEEEEEVDDAAEEELDIFAVEDIMDAGKGEPLFVGFTFEDWALLTLRYELFLLVNAFMHDADDEERKGVHETNLVYYYNKYYNKTLTPKHYGKENNQEVVDMVKDSVSIDKDSKVLKTNLESEVDAFDIFVKLTEECRRERQRRTDAGDETARLKFNALLGQVTKPAAVATTVGAKAATGALRPALGAVAPGAVRPAFGAVRPAGAPAWAGARPAGPATWRPPFMGYRPPAW